MRRNLYSLFAVIMLAAIVLSACSTATPGTTQTPAATPLPAGSVQINAGGATFPQPLYAEWTYAYQYVDPAVAINYQGIGSGGGINGIIANTLDFAGSDALLTDANYTAGKDLQMYPAVAGAVVLIYNVAFNMPAGTGSPTPTPTPAPVLVLDRQTVVDIFNAKITKWNDPAIVALNPAAKDMLPDAQITVVHRSDGSGTTQTFTKALTSFSPDWKAGAASAIQWPVDNAGNGVGGRGNPGVAAAVLNTKNSIGYVEFNYAVAYNIPFTKLVNKAGKTVTANADSLSSAMVDFSEKLDPTRLTVDLMDAPGDGSWPIATYTYYILHTTSMTDCTKAQKILEYIRWTLTDPSSAAKAKSLGYNVLPDAIRQQVLAKLALVTCSGNPVLK